jgi:hydrogenase nickel incorporation protein HypA/HybF
MHELSLVQSLLDIVEEYAQNREFSKVLKIKVSFGKASNIVPQAITSAFEILSEGTILEGAVIIFDLQPLVIYCSACNKNITIDSYRALCPLCESIEIKLVGGTEGLKLIEMDVE